MDEIYQRVFLKDSKACCQTRIINGCTGIIRSVDTEEKEQKKKNSLQFREVSENIYCAKSSTDLCWSDLAIARYSAWMEPIKEIREIEAGYTAMDKLPRIGDVKVTVSYFGTHLVSLFSVKCTSILIINKLLSKKS